MSKKEVKISIPLSYLRQWNNEFVHHICDKYLEENGITIPEESIYQPSVVALIKSDYHTYHYWTKPEFASQDCKCELKDIKGFKKYKVFDPLIIR
ncbi:MAG: hypothetical protein J5I47_07075 [Vicingus serpentipes]|nr:hypothetical protein [Vicingus serpentipes]